MTRYVIARYEGEAEWRATNTAYSFEERDKAVKALRVPGDAVYPVEVTAGKPIAKAGDRK